MASSEPVGHGCNEGNQVMRTGRGGGAVGPAGGRGGKRIEMNSLDSCEVAEIGYEAPSMDISDEA